MSFRKQITSNSNFFKDNNSFNNTANFVSEIDSEGHQILPGYHYLNDSNSIGVYEPANTIR